MVSILMEGICGIPKVPLNAMPSLTKYASRYNMIIDFDTEIESDCNQILGEGNFATVFAGKYKDRPVAIKMFKPRKSGNKSMFGKIYREFIVQS